MAIDDRIPPDRPSDSDLTNLFHQVYGEASPREEFVESLRNVLADELRGTLAASRNGKAESVQIDLSLDDAIQPAPRSAQPSAQRRRTRRTGRSLVAGLTAIVVVAVVAVWSSRPTYSWTSVVRALEQQPWVESSTEDDVGAQVRNWLSQTNRVVVRQSAGDVVWDDLGTRTRSQYRSGSDVLVQSELEQVPSVEQALLSFLLREAGRPEKEASELPSAIKVLEQSWRELPDDASRAIELSVTLGWGESPVDSIELVLNVDHRTYLPQLCRVRSDGGEDELMIRFEYPETGPRQVYDLGVPANVIVRHVDEIAGPVQTAALPQLPQLEPDDSAALPVPIQLGEIRTRTIAADDLARQAGATQRTVELKEKDPARAQAPPVPTVSLSAEEMTERIDTLLAGLWERNGITPVGRSSDLEFLRRVYLDLTGRVPTVSEVRDFLRDRPESRRERLVEQLLGRRDHATHLASVWRRFLLPEGVDLTQYGGTASFEQWLTEHFRANTPYDDLVRELLLAEGRVSESGPILFYTALKLEPESLAAQTARAFLGMRLECAQCHDHFFDERWKQEDFWGYAAFFARISRPQGKMDMVSPVLQVKDSTWGDVTLPDQEQIIPPRYPLGATLEEAEATSRRSELADWMTAPANPHFARATVNRVWAHLFGRGLVEPVDDMRSDHPPVSPELLDELAGYFVSTGFDLQDLFHVIVLTETYQRSSTSPDDDPSRALHFAQMNIKAFTAEQLYDSIAVATRLDTPAEADGGLVRATNMSRQAFIEQFRAPPGQATDYQSGIPQALTLMNGGLIQGATGLTSSGLLKSLEAPFFTDQQRVETLFLATVSRPPDESERQALISYATAEGADRAERLSDILWALLNSAEFTLNH